MGASDQAVTLGPVTQARGVTESGQLDVSSTQATGVRSFSPCVVPGSTVGDSQDCKDCCGSTQGLRIRSAAGTRADRGSGGASGVHVRCCRDLRSGRASCRHVYSDGFQVRQQGLDPTVDSLAAQKSWLFPSASTLPRGVHTAVEARDGGWAGCTQVHAGGAGYKWARPCQPEGIPARGRARAQLTSSCRALAVCTLSSCALSPMLVCCSVAHEGHQAAGVQVHSWRGWYPV